MLLKEHFFLWMVIPRYLNSLTFSTFVPLMLKVCLIFWLPAENIIVLVFDRLMRNRHLLQYSFAISRAFCSPSLDDDRRTISSAYAKPLIESCPFNVTGSQLFSLSFLNMSLMKRLKSVGLSGSPCLTPLLHLKNCVKLLPIFIAHSVFRYMYFRVSKKLPETPISWNL